MPCQCNVEVLRAGGQRRARAQEDGGGFGVAAVRRRGAVYRMLRIACSTSHAFRSCRRETVVDVLAVLRDSVSFFADMAFK